MKLLRKIYFEIWYLLAETFLVGYSDRLYESRAKRFEYQRKHDIY